VDALFNKKEGQSMGTQQRIKALRFMGVLTLSIGVAALVGLSPAGLLLPRAEAGHIVCGNTLGPGGSAALDSNVEPCGGAFALKVIGPFTLDLKDFWVICDGANDGIVVEGSGARIKNGGVADCDNHGVILKGTGGHRIEKVISRENGFDGFKADGGSHNNDFIMNTATDNFHGFAILSNGNKLERNTATRGEQDGFHLDNASFNKFEKNTAIDNPEDGFDICGGCNNNEFHKNSATGGGDNNYRVNGNDNEFYENSAIGSGDNGYRVSGNNNEFGKNTAISNRVNGFFITGDFNIFYHNTATGHREEGFDINNGGDNNTLTNNTATDNDIGFRAHECPANNNDFINNTSRKNRVDGFRIDNGCTFNDLKKNVAKGNGVFDMRDENAACDNNTWQNNTFNTSNDACIN
jgi:parallel beta-helix repeat protein